MTGALGLVTLARDSPAGRAILLLHVPEKTRVAAPDPIGSLIIIRPGPRAQVAEEDVPRGTNHNPHMPVPHHQISRLRPANALETRHAVIKIVGTRIFVRETGPFINAVHQV